MGCCLCRVAFLSNFIEMIEPYLAVFLQWATRLYHHTRRLCCTAPSGTGLIVGRTLVDPSRWKVPVLVSNFSQETVVVNPFTEVGMITQVTAIQSVVDDGMRPRGSTGELPYHLQNLVDQTSGNLDGDQRCRLAEVLLEYADIFPVPVCPTPHVTPEDEERRTMRHGNADRRPD